MFYCLVFLLGCVYVSRWIYGVMGGRISCYEFLMDIYDLGSRDCCCSISNEGLFDFLGNEGLSLGVFWVFCMFF